jgi:ATP-dependent DNA helicase RecG
MLRPPLLNPLFAGVEALKGVGPTTGKLLGKLVGDQAIPRVIDILLHMPVEAIDRRARVTVAEAQVGMVATVTVEVLEHRIAPPGRARAPHRVITSDGTSDLVLVYFAGDKGWLEKMMPVGSKRLVSGTIESFDAVKQMVHPDHVLDPRAADKLPTVETVYPLTEGLSRRALASAIAAALERLPELPEWIDPDYRARARLPRFADALRTIHRPPDPDALKLDGPAMRRLAYDELLAEQVAVGLLRARTVRAGGRVTRGDGRLNHLIKEALPYSLTGAQERAVADILADMAKDERMLRLLQGDVGSGKTVVALLAMAQAVEAGRQAALMAPTEILARQHFKTIEPLAERVGIKAALLTGRDKGRDRSATLALLKAGAIDLLIGTHAIFQDDVAFHDLALAVVDEQHRFGVHQRLALAEKGDGVDLLITTATPIPRTLVMTYYGDMEVSKLDEKPAGRQPITTRAIPLDRLEEVVEGVGRAIDGGARVYWICPLVEESEKVDQAAAESRCAVLREAFGPTRVGLLHGRMRGSEKDAAMAAFASGATQVLVATTVVEVGMDVPEATIIVIEQAERFGLAQLHQLRGRVGRGRGASSCLLLYDPKASLVARERLSVIRGTEDGFAIAEADLKLRGPGELLGTRQSGLPDMRIVRWEVHGDLVEPARDDAKLLLARDPELTSPRGEAVRLLMYLFDRPDALRLVEAG